MAQHRQLALGGVLLVCLGGCQGGAEDAGVGAGGGATSSSASGEGGESDGCALGDGSSVHIVDIAAGDYHVLAVDSCGRVYCWGSNDYHACGDAGGGPHLQTPAQLPDPGKILRVAAKSASSVVLRADGAVLSWGTESAEELGNGPGAPSDPATAVAALLPGPAREVRTWGEVGSALLETGDSYIWGNIWPGTGPDMFGRTATPTLVPYQPQVATHVVHCYLDDAGAARCAGDNRAGQVGDGTFEPRVDFVDVATPTRFVRLDGDGLTVLGITADGGVWGWGDNVSGRLGLPESRQRYIPSPRRIETVEGVTHLAASLSGACAWNDAGEVSCWGSVTDVVTGSPEAVRAFELEPARKVEIGSLFVCSFKHDDTVWCLGNPMYRGVEDAPDDDLATRVIFNLRGESS